MDSLSGSAIVHGAWTTECPAVFAQPGASGANRRYARFYNFTLAQTANVSISLNADTDTYLVVRHTHDLDSIVAENDDAAPGDYNSALYEMLKADAYTIEATTYGLQITGAFTLTLQIGADERFPNPTPATPTATHTPTATPTPNPTSEPTPTPTPSAPTANITQAACIQSDLDHLGDYTQSETIGPIYYDTPNHDGITAYYRTRWADADNPDAPKITCTAAQFDGIKNARWNTLDYSAVIQEYAIGVAQIREHRQLFIHAPIGDGALALQVRTELDGIMQAQSEVRFLHADTLTGSAVAFTAPGGAAYPDIAAAESVARAIAARIDGAQPAQSEQGIIGMLQSVLRNLLDIIR